MSEYLFMCPAGKKVETWYLQKQKLNTFSSEFSISKKLKGWAAGIMILRSVPRNTFNFLPCFQKGI